MLPVFHRHSVDFELFPKAAASSSHNTLFCLIIQLNTQALQTTHKQWTLMDTATTIKGMRETA